ncbi:MAG: hypothetical protein EBS91_04865 [Betaproteobacteria bacterium]|nr:hypothetical protein [Betaproteobacteria bacterium]
MNIPIRLLLALRQRLPDQVVLDYLTLAHMTPNPGTVATTDLRNRWACSQSQVSRRLSAVLVDLTPGWGAYQVHAVTRLEVGG